MKILFGLALVLVLSPVPGFAQSVPGPRTLENLLTGDSIRRLARPKSVLEQPALDTAWTEYARAYGQVEAEYRRRLQEQLDAASTAGDLDQAVQLDKQLKAFEKTGLIPDDEAVDIAIASLHQEAVNALREAYETLKKRLTQEKNFAVAQDVDREWKAVGPALPPPALEKGLIATFAFDGDCNDTSGALRHGKPQGGTARFIEDRTKAARHALEFRGDSWVELGNQCSSNEFTVSLWLRPAPQQVDYANIIDNNHSDHKNWVCQQSGKQVNTYHFGVALANGSGVVIPFTLKPATWQHLVLVKDKDDAAVYVDGRLVEKKPAGPVRYAGDQFLRLGQFAGGGRGWRGVMDDVRIWNRGLAANEVDALDEPAAKGAEGDPKRRAGAPPPSR